MYFFDGNTILGQVALKVGGHRFGETDLDGWVGDDNKTPRLTIVRGGRIRRGGENIFNNGVRDRVRSEAAYRTPRP